ncbi:MAG: hypothetical protein F4X19_08215 [Acidobacteria bacterium]|nr:hypothetical protein [Acidobacteriota bacterium]
MALSSKTAGFLSRGWVVAALLALLQPFPCPAEADSSGPPEILSLFPLGGRPGEEFEGTLRGRGLEGANELWFDSGGVRATVLGLRNEKGPKPEETPQSDAGAKPVQLLSLRFQVDPAAQPGSRSLRAITPRGLSHPLTFHVHAEPGHRESLATHDLASEAESLPEWPLAVHGTLGQPAEVDYYAFTVAEGERLRFEVRSLELSDLAITLFEPAGSWFSPDRARRLAFSDEPVSYPELSTEPVLRHRFGKAGRFLVRVSGFMGEGGPDHPYLLRITRDAEGKNGEASGSVSIGSSRDLWQERSWTRELRADRMDALRARTASLPRPPSRPEPPDVGQDGTGKPPLPETIPVIELDEAPDEASKAMVVTLPSLLVGSIEHPGDIDRVRFEAKVGDRIALEIETPRATVPVFNPYLKMVDAEGAEVLTNVHSILNANTEIEKQIRPKVIHSFPRAGEFTLEIRDITAAFGGPSMAYRVLIRPQVPHMGQIHVAEGHLNLVAGTATPLSLVTDQEEHFEGSIALSLAGLPPGVTAVAGTRAEPDAPPAVNEGRKERYVSRSRKATLVLVAAADAPATPVPVPVKVMAQPVEEGRMGRMTPVKDLLLMVVAPVVPTAQSASNPVEKTVVESDNRRVSPD